MFLQCNKINCCTTITINKALKVYAVGAYYKYKKLKCVLSYTSKEYKLQKAKATRHVVQNTLDN